MQRALFFPSYFGGGFGHIGRSLAFASALEEKGWTTAFALNGPHLERVAATGQARQIYRLRRPYQPSHTSRQGPAFTVIGDLSYQLVRDGLVSTLAIRSSIAEQLGVIDQFKPDLLVSDVWPMASILAHLSGLPLVQITRAMVHPCGPGLIWWQPRPAELVSPDLRPVFNPLLESWGLAPLQQAEDLLKGDLHIVAGLPELEPLPSGIADTCYAGPFVRANQAISEEHPGWLEDFDPARPLVYITSGGGAQGVGGAEFFHRMIQALEARWSRDYQFVISTGAHLPLDSLPTPPPGVHLLRWAPGPAVIARSRLVVYPGGYGTSMEMVRAGVPGLVIPAHTEQESNGRRLQAAGAAEVQLPVHTAPEVTWHPGPTGRFSTLEAPEFELTSKELSEKLRSTLEDESLLSGAQRLQKLTSTYPGPAYAATLVEEWLQARQGGRKEPGWRQLSWWQKLQVRTLALF